MNYDKLINIWSLITLIGLIISAIGVFYFRHYTSKKNEQSFLNATEHRTQIKDSVDAEFSKTVTAIHDQRDSVNQKIENEAFSIIAELKEKSKNANSAIEELRRESNKASTEISKEVEKIIKATEIQLPIKINGYVELHSYVNELLYLLKKMYDDSVPYQAPESMNEFLNKGFATKSWDYLFLECDPNIKPHTQYGQLISSKANSIYKKGDKIIERYSKAIDAKMIKNLHEINESGQIRLLRALQQLKQNKNLITQPPILKGYSARFTGEQLKIINELNNWCETKNKEYLEYGVNENLPFKYIVSKNFNSPTCIASEELRAKKIIEFKVEK